MNFYNFKIKIIINIIIFIYLLNVLYNLIKNTPFISIIIPVYNSEKYLSLCLNSIINQTITNIEIICIDDGSTDHSIKIIKDYLKKDNRIKLISQKNKGPGIARNKGIIFSKGEFIAFMDSDDIYPNNNVLELMYNKCIKNDVYICGGGLKYFREKDKRVKIGKKMNIFSFRKEGIINYIDYQFDFAFYRFLYKRTLIIKNKIYYPNYFKYEDPPFFIKAMIYAKKFYALKETTYLYRFFRKRSRWNVKNLLDHFNGLKECLILSYKYNLNKLYCQSINRLNTRLFLNPFKYFIKNKKLKKEVFILLKKYVNITKCKLNLNNIYIKLINYGNYN